MKLSILILLILAMQLPLHASELDPRYQVTQVLSSETLNVRSGPGTQYSITQALPYNARNIELIETQSDSNWVKIRILSEAMGWVNRQYLKEEKDAPPTDYKCGGTEPFWDIGIHSSQVAVKILSEESFTVPLILNHALKNIPNESVVVKAADNQHAFTAFISNGSCNDGMSDKLFDYYLMTIIDDKIYSGCCRAVNQ